jgi:lysine decarboxylase
MDEVVKLMEEYKALIKEFRRAPAVSVSAPIDEEVAKSNEDISNFFGRPVIACYSGTTGSNRMVILAHKLWRKDGPVISIGPFHKSVYESAMVLDREIIALKPGGYISEFDVLYPPEPELVRKSLKKAFNPLCIITNPTYGGLILPKEYLCVLVDSVKLQKGVLLLDNAWGHGGLKTYVPLQDKCLAVATRSSHKIDGAPQPISLIILIDVDEDFQNCLEISRSVLETTSPPFKSLFFTAGIYELLGRGLEDYLMTFSLEFRDKLKEAGLSIMEKNSLKLPSYLEGASIDPRQIMINTQGKCGYKVAERLYKRGCIVERAGLESIELLVTLSLLDKYFTNKGILDYFSSLIMEAIKESEFNSFEKIDAEFENILNYEVVKKVRGAPQYLPLEKAIGKYLYQAIVPYPPGIPIILPGALLTKEIAEYVKTIIAMGGHVMGIIHREGKLKVPTISE